MRLFPIQFLALLLGLFSFTDRLTAHSHDANGNTLLAPELGVLTPDRYDDEDQLSTRTPGLGAPIVTLHYNGDGERVAKTVTAPGGTSVTTFFLTDNLNPTGYEQVLEELAVEQGQIEPVRLRTYDYALNSQDQVLADAHGALAWHHHFYGYDDHGSVRYLTDAAGQVTDTYDYDAFGNLIQESGSTPNQNLFAGELFDPDLDLYYNRARYYQPATGRFWTRDPFAGYLSAVE